jgi:hypothetical protein
MGGGLIDEFLTTLWRHISDTFSSLLAPLLLIEWWGLFGLFFVALLVIGYFLPFKWIRAGLGALLLLAGAFVAGGTKMYRDLKRRGD